MPGESQNLDKSHDLDGHSYSHIDDYITLDHERALARTRDLWRDTITTLWPYKTKYPGWRASAAAVVGYAEHKARRWLYAGSWGVPIPAAEKLVAYLESRIAHEQELLSHWRQYVKNTDYAANAKRELKRKKAP